MSINFFVFLQCLLYIMHIGSFQITNSNIYNIYRHNKLMMVRSYKAVNLLAPKTKTKSTILVRDDANDIVDMINTWTESSKIDDNLVEKWMEEGRAFWLTSQGTRAMHLAERRSWKEKPTIKKPSTLKYAVDTYINIGNSDNDNEMILIKESSGFNKNDVDSNAISLDTLESKGLAFRNIDKLIADKKLVNKIDSITDRVTSEFPIASDEWQRWTNQTNRYNSTSLTQVMSEYFKDYSIGDCGGEPGAYVPKPGYPGTLAPGNTFVENVGLDDLPNKVLHPWPAMQQFQFHVRQPVAHPMIPPPILWFALNGMYTDNFTETQLALPADEIVGGTLMNPRDAIRIAKYSEIGRSYDPSVQIEHGGMKFKGRNIPHYNPDHGPTYDDCEPPITEELRRVTDLWLDPMIDLKIKLPPELESTDSSTLDEEEAEEEARRVAAQRMLDSLDPSRDLERAQQASLEGMLQEVVNSNSQDNNNNNNNNNSEDEEGIIKKASVDQIQNIVNGEITDLDAWNEEVEIENENLLDAPDPTTRNVRRTFDETIVQGRSRSQKALIRYAINQIRDMQAEIISAERDLATRKKSGRRKQRKTKTSKKESSAE